MNFQVVVMATHVLVVDEDTESAAREAAAHMVADGDVEGGNVTVLSVEAMT